MTNDVRNLHIFFLLDRSGSMEPMADDVVGGFNGFLAAQQAEGHDALMTLVQFDSQDPHEVLVNARPIAEVRPLDRARFHPRGGTPLYDAIGHLIADATIRAEKTAIDGGAAEEVLFGYAAGSTQNFAPDGAGAAAAFASLAPAVSRHRAKIRSGEAYDPKDLFEGDKGAEADLWDRTHDSPKRQ